MMDFTLAPLLPYKGPHGVGSTGLPAGPQGAAPLRDPLGPPRNQGHGHLRRAHPRIFPDTWGPTRAQAPWGWIPCPAVGVAGRPPTLSSRNCPLMLAYLLDNRKPELVKGIFDMPERRLPALDFALTFPAIPADRGGICAARRTGMRAGRHNRDRHLFLRPVGSLAEGRHREEP
jgi:hypothetical protein